MAVPANLDWLYHLLGWALGVAGVVLFVWAMFWDRSRGRRRCPKCWYDMRGTPGLKCPECGHEAQAEVRLYRIRRRRRVAVIGAVGLIVGVTTVLVPAYQHGWIASLPNWVLVNVADPSGQTGIQSELAAEAWGRIGDGRLTGWTARRFIRRCVSRGPPPEEWVSLPDAWPLGHTIFLMLRDPVAGSQVTSLRLRVPSVSAEWITRDGFQSPSVAAIPAVYTPTQQLQMEVQVVRSWWPVFPTVGAGAVPTKPGNAGEVFYSKVISVPIRLRGDDTTFLDTTDSDEANALVRRALDPRLIRAEDGELYLGINDTSDAGVWKEADFGMVFSSEVLVGKRVAVAQSGGGPSWGRAVWKDWEEVHLDWSDGGRATLETALVKDPASVRIILRASPELAMQEYLKFPFNKPRPLCWSGVIEVPGRVTDRSSTAGQ